MLDTTIVSHLVRGHPSVLEHVMAVPMSALVISAITQGELAFGLARRPEAKRLHRAVDERLKRVDVLPWDSNAAVRCGALRSDMEGAGQGLGALDLLIAAHTLSEATVLVTNDQGFTDVMGLETQDWTIA